MNQTTLLLLVAGGLMMAWPTIKSFIGGHLAKANVRLPDFLDDDCVERLREAGRCLPKGSPGRKAISEEIARIVLEEDA